MRERLEAIVEEMIRAGIRFEDAVGEFEKIFILRVLNNNHENISRASEELGLHRNTLSKKLERYRETTQRSRRTLRKNASSNR